MTDNPSMNGFSEDYEPEPEDYIKEHIEDLVEKEDEECRKRLEAYSKQKMVLQDNLRMLNTTDPKANYIVGSKGLDKDMLDRNEDKEIIEYTPLDKVDYGIVKEENIDNEDTKIDKRNTISFMNVKTIEEGIEWYKKEFPKIPDDLYPIMARWNWGDLSTLTKKDIKNDKKRLKKGKKPKQMCLEKKVGKYVVDFD